MFRFSAVGLVFVIAIAAGGCQMPLEEFSSPEYKFKAKFPGKPKEQDQSQMGITVKMFMTESKNGSYGVAVANIPPGIPGGGDLDGAVNGIVRSGNGTVKSNNPITVNGKYPGREFSATITQPKQGQARGKVFIAGNRLYQVLVLGTDSFANGTEANEFLNSFVLLD